MLKIGLVVVAGILMGKVAGAQELIWREMTELPRPVAGYMAGVSHGRLVIIGGSYWENKQKHWTDVVQVFDPRSNTWNNEAPLPSPRSDGASATLGDDIYLFGGGKGTDVGRDGLVLHAGKWSAVASGDLPESRLYATAIASGGYIYLLGGMSKAGDYKTVANTFWRWRPGAKQWEMLPALPGPGRINHAMAEVRGSIYVLGGATTGPVDVENLKDAYKYNLHNKTWTKLPDLKVANRAWWAVGIGGRALVLAGYTNDFAREAYWYDPQRGLTDAGVLPHGLADTKFFRIVDVVVGAGGEAGPGIRGKWTLQAQLPESIVKAK
jgi:N-acetylneuraminic acid mutarotase